MLNALASENRVNVLSIPHVMTSENKKAVINVSTSIPIVTSQQVPIGGTTRPDGREHDVDRRHASRSSIATRASCSR